MAKCFNCENNAQGTLFNHYHDGTIQSCDPCCDGCGEMFHMSADEHEQYPDGRASHYRHGLLDALLFNWNGWGPSVYMRIPEEDRLYF